MMSACVHGVVQSLTRTPRSWPAQPGAASAAATRLRASALASGATASSRSRKTSSAGRPLDLSIIFWLLPGTDRHVRRGRYALFTPHSYPLNHGLDQQGVRGAAGANAGAGPDGRVPRPGARRRGQHQHRSPATPGPRAGRRNDLAPKDFRTDPAGGLDRAQRGDAQHQQRLDAAGSSSGPAKFWCWARSSTPRCGSTTPNCRSSPTPTSSSPTWAWSRAEPATGWSRGSSVRVPRRLGRRSTTHIVGWRNVQGLTPSALAMPGQAVAQLLHQFEKWRPIEVADAVRELPVKRRYEVVQRARRRPAGRHPAGAAGAGAGRTADAAGRRARRRRARGDGSRRRRRPARHDESDAGRAAAAADGPRGLRPGAAAAEALTRHRGRA